MAFNEFSDMTTKLRSVLDQHEINWIDASDFCYQSYYDFDDHIHSMIFHCERTRFNLYTDENGEERYRTSVIWNWSKYDQENRIGMTMGFPYKYEVWDKSYNEDPIPMTLEEIESIFMDRTM